MTKAKDLLHKKTHKKLSLPEIHKFKHRNTTITFDFRWNIPNNSQHNAPANEMQVIIINAWETFSLSKKRRSYHVFVFKISNLDLCLACIEHTYQPAITCSNFTIETEQVVKHIQS